MQVLLALLISIAGQLLLVLILPAEASNSIARKLFFDSGDSYWPMIFSYLGTAAVITASVWLSGKYLDKRKFCEFGFQMNSNWWTDFFFGVGLGGVLILLIFLIELLAGWISITGFFITENPSHSFIAVIWLPLFLFITVGFYEELLSRGYQLTNLAEGLAFRTFPPKHALVLATTLSSVIFAFLHLANPNSNLFSTFNIFLAGLLLAFGYIYTGQLAISIGLHISWNFIQGNVFGFPVSGAHLITASVLKIHQSGPPIWTGGSFGPEGGILGAISSLLGMGLIFFYLRFRYNKTELFTQISKPPSSGLISKKELLLDKNQHG